MRKTLLWLPLTSAKGNNGIPEQPRRRRYDVHLFAVVRHKVAGIEASSHCEAIETALVETDLHTRFGEGDTQYAEEHSHFLVDVVGDAQYSQSKWFYSQDVPLLSNLARLVLWFESGRRDEELEQIVRDARDVLANSI